MEYIKVIKYAVLCFPIVCLLLSLPFLFHHYRKYGSITFLTYLLGLDRYLTWQKTKNNPL